MKVTMYRNNRVDQAATLSPDDLASEFIATIRGKNYSDYQRSGRVNVEFEYRWWLSSPQGPDLAWHEKDWPALWEALMFRYDGDDAVRQDILNWVAGRED